MVWAKSRVDWRSELRPEEAAELQGIENEIAAVEAQKAKMAKRVRELKREALLFANRAFARIRSRESRAQ